MDHGTQRKGLDVQGSFFRVDGADVETGEETYLVLQAPTPQDAEQIARGQGLLISAVRAATPADWGAPPPPAPLLPVPVYAAVPETIVFESVDSQEGTVTQSAALATPWSQLEESTLHGQPLALAEPDAEAKPDRTPQKPSAADPFELANTAAPSARVASIFSDHEVPFAGEPEAISEKAAEYGVATESMPEPHRAPAVASAPSHAEVPAMVDAVTDLDDTPEPPAPVRATGDAPLEIPAHDAPALVAAAAVPAAGATTSKPAAISDEIAHVPAAAVRPAPRPPHAPRPVVAAAPPSKAAIATARKGTGPASPAVQGKASVTPGKAAPTVRSTGALRPGGAPRGTSQEPRRSTKAPMSAAKAAPPLPPAAPPAAPHTTTARMSGVTEPAVVSEADSPELAPAVAEAGVGSGMEQVVTKLALDQTAHEVEHSVGSALERLTGIDESPAYAPSSAHAAEYSSESFAAEAQLPTAHAPAPAAAPTAASPDEVPTAWVAAPAVPARAQPAPAAAAPGGVSLVTVLVCPLAFLLFAGGAGLLAYALLHNVEAGDNDMLRLDLRLQSLTYCLLGGLLLIAGLLGFVAAGMAYLAAAVRRNGAR